MKCSITCRRLAKTGFARAGTFTESYDPSLPAVTRDRDQLIQVFLNLAKNACDALQAKPTARSCCKPLFGPASLSVAGTRDRLALPLEVSVRDNGPGVPADMLASMFEPFVTSKPKGAGWVLPLWPRSSAITAAPSSVTPTAAHRVSGRAAVPAQTQAQHPTEIT